MLVLIPKNIFHAFLPKLLKTQASGEPTPCHTYQIFHKSPALPCFLILRMEDDLDDPIEEVQFWSGAKTLATPIYIIQITT